MKKTVLAFAVAFNLIAASESHAKAAMFTACSDIVDGYNQRGTAACAYDSGGVFNPAHYNCGSYINGQYTTWTLYDTTLGCRSGWTWY